VRGPGVLGIGGGVPAPGPVGPVGVWGMGGRISNDKHTGSPGVFGQAYNEAGFDADGVVGQGNHSYSGVAGFGGSNRGSGIFGLGGGTGQTRGPGATIPVIALASCRNGWKGGSQCCILGYSETSWRDKAGGRAATDS
jgi:hypothetical protein